MKRGSRIGLAWMVLLVLLAAAAPVLARPWSFGVMSDTQWTENRDLDGKNPNTVAVEIINQLNRQFIHHGVKFVIQVGDLTDRGNAASTKVCRVPVSPCPSDPASFYTTTNLQALDTRAIFAQSLYNAGIGFFPVRGNHEDLQDTAVEFTRIFPQTLGGQQNASPSNVFTIPNPDAATQPFPARVGSPFYLGTYVGSPSINGLAGLSYAFDYGNVRFVLLDQFTRTDGTGKGNANNNILDQLPWAEAMLASKPTRGHAFVFAHKNLIGEQHTDTLFGANPASNLQGQETFFSSLAGHGVRYFMSGHDHVHQRSLIASPNAAPKVQEIICASDSSKFYIPLGNELYQQTLPTPTVTVNNDLNYNTPANGVYNGPRETSIAQELYKVGYYVVTVDGPRVTVDYYSADNTGAVFSPEAGELLISTTPVLEFTRKERFGYSLNGKEFEIGQGGSYTAVQDSYQDTKARILDGVNRSQAEDGSYRPLTKLVSTGWTRADEEILASEILSLWGMEDLGKRQTDEYVLAVTYDHGRVRPRGLGHGEFGLASRDRHGEWVNAVDLNSGGTNKFVLGPWQPGYPLGTYGVDPSSHTAWAVLNHAGDFAVGRDLEPRHRK